MKVNRETQLGSAYAIGAFTCWGFVPLYYLILQHVSAFELLVHRAVWTSIALIPLILLFGLRGSLLETIRDRRTVATLACSAFLIGCNWLVFTWAVTNGHVIETSMGYFINPLVNVLLGVVILGERLRPMQMFSVGLAAAGVILLIYNVGQLPWIALALPFTFGLYGLIRKGIKADTFSALFIETTMLAPFAISYLLYLAVQSEATFLSGDGAQKAYLALLGPITIVPLAFFGAAAKRITLTALGFFQYIGPSVTFILGILVFKESFDSARMITFALIWASLAVYSAEGILESRRLVARPAD